MCSKNVNNSRFKIDPEHLSRIDLSGYVPCVNTTDVVLIPLISGDNVFLHDWPLFWKIGTDPDNLSEAAFYVPYEGALWPVRFVADTLAVCDQYIF